MHTRLNIVVHGGYVQSNNDWQIHYITPRQLYNLYGLNINASNIIIVEEYDYPSIVSHSAFRIGYIHIYPRQDGKYSLFKLLFKR